MRRVLFSVLISSLLAGCSLVQSVEKYGPHRIDVQQGNALDQENVARLKLGLNRSQVRFLLGTPLVIDPFRNDRWDYVYLFYEAGTLVEQKRITLFFDGDTLARIEGDVPAAMRAPQPPVASAPVALVAPVAVVATPTMAAAPAIEAVATPSPKVLAAPVSQSAASSRIVPPLPSPKNAPAYVDPHTPAELSPQPEIDVAPIKSESVTSSPSPAAPVGNDPVLMALNAWANAWAQRDDAAYFAAYDSRFVPQDGGDRADWEARRRMLLGRATDIDFKIESPTVARGTDGSATATFNQFYRSGNYSDAVVKQLRMIEREGRWLIVEEKVLSVLHGGRP